MTNKNLKLAAMSVALTACVAAQPLVAHAVDAPAEPESKDPDTTITEGAVIDTSKKDEESGKTGKIGEATKTETVDPDASTTEVEMGKTTTHPGYPDHHRPGHRRGKG